MTRNGKTGIKVKDDPATLARMMHQILLNHETAIMNCIALGEPTDKSYKRSSERLLETRKLLEQVVT